MVVKSGPKDQLIFEGNEPQSVIEISKKDNQFSLTIKSGGKSMEIAKPGEYEVAGIEVFGRELTDKKEGVINVLFFSIDNINLLLTENNSEMLFEWVKTLPFIDILLISDTSELKDAMTKIDPAKVLIALNSSADAADLKKFSSLPINKEKQFKFKDTDFNRDEENPIVELSILS